MKVTAFKTPILKKGDDLYQAIAQNVPQIPERSVLVVASKIVSTCEGRFMPKIEGTKSEKHQLVRKEADLYLDPHSSKYGIMLSIKANWMFVNAGIDESNADDHYLLWPKDLQSSVNGIWQFVREHYGVKEVGVTISDSSSMPLNWGVTGHALTYCGFNPLKSYIGKPDLFGRLMQMEKVNIMQSLTTAAVLEMGEGNEGTPLGLVEEIKDIEFQNQVPSAHELAELKIELEDDAFGPLLTAVEWKKGQGGA